MEVEVEGTPVVAIRLAKQHMYVTVPGTLDGASRYVEGIVNSLLPYVWVRPDKGQRRTS